MEDLMSTLSQATGAPMPTQPMQQGAQAIGQMSPAQAIAQIESSGAPATASVSNPASSAQGRMQVLGGTNSDPGFGVRPGNGTLADRTRVGEDYLNAMTQRYGNSSMGALAYTWGPGNVDKWLASGADPSQVPADKMHYVQRFMQMTGGGSTPVPTTPGQSYSGQQTSGYTGPTSDLMSTLQAATSGGMQPAQGIASMPSAQQPETGVLQKFGRSAAGLADTVLSAPGAAVQAVDYAARRALQQSPEEAQTASGRDFGGAVHPVGNAFGVTNTPEYQGEASQRAMGAVSNIIDKGATAIANATGLPQQDVANMAGTATMLVPGAIKAGARTVAPVARNIASVAGEAAAQTAADDLNVRPAAATAPTSPEMQPRSVVGGGAASTNLNPYPILTGEDVSRGAFPQVKLSKVAQDVTPQEQAVRSGIANEIMGENAGTVRSGVITGNENTLRDEYAAAKSPNQTPASLALKAQIANEQQALANYAEQRVNATGASQTLGSNEERGRVINDALYGDQSSLSSYLRDAKRSIYDQARTTAGDNPIQTSHVDSLLNDPQFQASVRLSNNEGTMAGAADLINLARTTGFRDPITGDLYAPNSVAAWDAVRKSINSEWNPSNRNVVRQINGAIDSDIAATGGEEMYKLGDRIHQVEKTLLDSRGIGSVLGQYDANGIKTGPSLESIPDKLNSMPADQWQHIHDTLDELSRGQIRGAPDGMPEVPQEIRQAAAQARSEMDGSLARSVYQAGADKAGVWNQNSVNKVLNSSVGQKIAKNFSPEEVQAFHTLNYGGQIMPGVHSYEGAGNQLARLSKPGFVEKFAPRAATSAGATVGAHIPIPGAAWAGAAIGEGAGRKLSTIIGNKREQAQLKSITEEMSRNAQLNHQASGVPLNSLIRNQK